MKRQVVLGMTLVLVLSACGESSEASTTEADASETATTGAELPTTTTASPASTTTTTIAPTTTTSPEPPVSTGDATERAQAKVDAVAAAAPDGWTTTIEAAADFESDQDALYDACLEPGEFDIDSLDGVSVAALVANVAAPPPQGGFLPPPEASIEARVMESEAVAEEAFTVFTRLYGSEEGVECIMQAFTDEMGDDIPAEEFTLEVSRQLLDDADAGVQFRMVFEIEGFSGGITIDFQGARVGDTIVVGTYFAFGEPIEPDVANALFSAAVNG